MFGWLFNKAASGVIEAAGTAINKNIKTLRGDRAEEEAAIHAEQMAVLSQHAAEFVSRPVRTHLDSIIDFLNRLPRVIITFWIFMIFTWPAVSPDTFLRYILSLELIPEPLWQFSMVVVGLYFGGRVLSQDIKPPRLSKEQRDYAIKTVEKQQEVILESRKPLVVEVAPTRKPPPPQWAQEIIDKPKTPIFKPDPKKPQEFIKGRPVEVDKIIDALIKREGGFSNDPSDSGGPTKFGITHKTLSAWRGTTCWIDEVKALTKEEAKDIYLKEYYFGPSIDSLPVPIQAHCLDISANSGPSTAIKMLQETLRGMGSQLRIDGVCGPMTREACNAYDISDINNALVDKRIIFYKELASRRPKDKRFLNGWLKRAESFRV